MCSVLSILVELVLLLLTIELLNSFDSGSHYLGLIQSLGTSYVYVDKHLSLSEKISYQISI